ncbi:MAG: hypothetical protein ACOCWX_03885 [Spirochaetota bacterium]
MRLLLSSRTVSRKSPRRLLLFFVIAALLAPVSATAQVDHTINVGATRDYLAVSVDVSGADAAMLFANINDGLTARLEFIIRVLEARRGLLSVFGSRMLREFRVIYETRYDPFRRRYTVTTQDGGFYTFGDRARLLDFFFTLPGYRIPWAALGLDHAAPDAELVVETRVVYEPIVFAPGLSILSGLMSDTRRQSPWRVVPVRGGT